MNNDLRIRLQLDPASVDWESIYECLTSRYKMEGPVAKNKVKHFIRKVCRFVDLSWFKSAFLDEDDEKISTCLAGHYGADVVTLFWRSKILPRCFVSQIIEIEPWPRYDEKEEKDEDIVGEVTDVGRIKGKQRPLAIVDFFGRQIFLKTFFHAVLVQICFSIIGMLFYALLAGLLLYGTAVFLLFLEDPELMTIAITRNVELFLAFTALCVFVAGIGGRAASNLIALMREKIALLIERSEK